MCWSILYRENKISSEKCIKDYNIYKKVNVLENCRYMFQINEIYIQNKLYYDISHKQCACDFFNPKNLTLRKEFEKLILARMEILCVEPIIYLKWIEDNSGIKNMSSNVININQNEILTIFSKGYKETSYCVKRINGDKYE